MADNESNGEAISYPPIEMHDMNMADIHEVSMLLLDLLDEENIDVPLGTAGVALTLGRAASPRVLEPDEEAAFLKAIMEFAQLYFVEGRAN